MVDRKQLKPLAEVPKKKVRPLTSKVETISKPNISNRGGTTGLAKERSHQRLISYRLLNTEEESKLEKKDTTQEL